MTEHTSVSSVSVVQVDVFEEPPGLPRARSQTEWMVGELEHRPLVLIGHRTGSWNAAGGFTQSGWRSWKS